MNRPFVYINMAMTADGKITSAGREYPRFTSPADRKNMDRLRAEADAIMVGAGTIRADNPSLHVRDAQMQIHRAQLGKPAGLKRVLVTASASLNRDSRFFSEVGDGGRIIVTVKDAPAVNVAALENAATIWRIGRGTVDLAAVLERLRAEGTERLLVEGGGELNWCLVRDDLVDELHLTVAPSLLGGRSAPTLLEGEGLTMEQQKRMRLADVRREGDELFCRYELLCQ